MAKSKKTNLAEEEAAADAIISTPYALEMRQRNSAGTNYISPNLYGSIPPDNAPGLVIYTGNFDIETVTLGAGLSWTPEDAVTGTPGRLDVTVSGGVQPDWNATSGAAQILNRPTLAAVATSGAYADLTGKPALFSGAYADLTGSPPLGTAAAQNTGAFATAAQGALAATAVQPGALAVVASTGQYSDLAGKPTPFSGAYSDLTGRPTLGTAAATASSDYATAAQGFLASTALQPAAIGTTVQAFSAALNTFSSNGSAFYLARANHTGTQAISTVTGLQAALDGKFPIPTGNTGQYLRGDGSPSAFPTLVSTFTNDAGYLTSSALTGYVTNASLASTLGGYPTNASLTASLAGYATTAALTSGLAAKFNSPAGTTAQYIRGDGTLASFPAIPSVPTNVSAFTNDAGYLVSSALAPYATSASVTSGLALKFNTPAGTTAQYLRGDGTTAAFPAIPAAQVQSDWNAVSGLGAILNKPTIPTIATPVFSNPTRALNTAFQISATRMAFVSYFVDIATSISLTGGQAGNVFLDYADDSGFTTNVVTFGPAKNIQTGALTIGLSLNQTVTTALSFYIPAGKYVRLRTVNVTGTPTFTSLPGQEVQF